jgi:hypothetical protein
VEALGDEEGAEGRDRRQRRLDQKVVGGSGDEHRREADQKPDQQPSPGDDDKGRHGSEPPGTGCGMRRPGEDQREGAKQTISIGPVASQEIIKELGTNGSGFGHRQNERGVQRPFQTPGAGNMTLLVRCV